MVLPLAFGNTVVIKPSEEAPISAGLLDADILDEAGFPDGRSTSSRTRPARRCRSPTSFSSSRGAVHQLHRFVAHRAEAGRPSRARAQAIVLELGGYNPLIVLADADLTYAVDSTAFGAFFHQARSA